MNKNYFIRDPTGRAVLADVSLEKTLIGFNPPLLHIRSRLFQFRIQPFIFLAERVLQQMNWFFKSFYQLLVLTRIISKSKVWLDDLKKMIDRDSHSSDRCR